MEHLPLRFSRCSCRFAKRLTDRGDRRLCRLAIRASGLRHVATATAALTAKLGGGRPYQSNGIEALGQICRDADDNTGLSVWPHPDYGHNARADVLFSLIGQGFQVLHLYARHGTAEEFNAIDLLDRFSASVSGSPHREFLARLAQLAFEFAPLIDEIGQAFCGIFFGSLEQGRDIMQKMGLRIEMTARRHAGLGFDTADACRDSAFRNDRDKSDIA